MSYRFASVFMHAESILNTPCQKYTTTPKIISLLEPYISSFILQQLWPIYIEGVFLILCSPSIIISLYLQKMRVSPERFGMYSKKVIELIEGVFLQQHNCEIFLNIEVKICLFSS